jgi:PAS domain S-box-containing protein
MEPFKFINTLNETESEMARREYITRNVLFFLFIVAFSFTLISFILYLSGKMPLDTLIIYLIISIMLFAAMFLTAKGYWRVAGIIPPLLMYLTAVTGNYIGGIDAPGNFMYVLMIIFIAIIYGYKKMWITLGICLPTYLCLAWMISSGHIKPFRTAEVAFINRVVITSGFFIIISLMIWILGRSYRKEIDIRIKADENLRMREESYRTIFENTGTSMILIEEDMSISMANDEFVRNTGYSLDEIIGRMKWTELVHPDEISRMLEQHRLRREIDGEALQGYELRYMTKSGDMRDALLNIQLVPGTKKSIASLIDISDRKRADEELRESEEKYRLLFENVGEGILIVQGDMIKFANPALADMLGYPSDIITTRPFYSFIHPDDRAIVVDSHMRRMRGELMETGYDFRILTADGTQRRLHIISRVISWGGIASSLSFVMDITEHRRMEEALHEAEEIYRNIFMNSQIGLFRTDIQTGMVLEANDSMAHFAGYKNREELLSSNFNIAERYIDPQARKKMIALIKERGQCDNYETQFRRNDGSVIWIRLSAKLVPAKGCLEGVSEDITEEKNTREALRKSEERYRTLVENASDIIFRTDNTGHFTFVNPAALRITGYEEEVIIGMHYPELIRPDMRDEAIKFFGRQFVKGLNNTYSEYPIITKKGEEVWFGQNTQLIVEDGNVTGFQSVARDITERKQVEKKLQNTLESLRKAVGATIQVMVSAIEVRDPYTAGHQIRSAGLARAIATEMGLSPDKIEGIRVASSIHDIGKLSIPSEILSKPTKLSELEFSLIKEHAQKGYEILKDVESPWPLAEIVCQHHERMDGSGYPKNLKGNDILIEARILIVADVVEAMDSHRPYRPSLGIDTALEEIEKNRGTLYDKAVADACLRLFREKGFKLEGT